MALPNESETVNFSFFAGPNDGPELHPHAAQIPSAPGILLFAASPGMPIIPAVLCLVLVPDSWAHGDCASMACDAGDRTLIPTLA